MRNYSKRQHRKNKRAAATKRTTAKHKAKLSKQASTPPPAPPSTDPPEDSHGFMALLLTRISWAQLCGFDGWRKNPAGRPCRKLPRPHLLVGLLFHYSLHLAGTFAEHLQLLGFVMAESTLSERRMALPFDVFVELLRRILRPVAHASKHTEAFYKKLKLVALDGVEFSLANTAPINQQMPKGGNQKGRAAFAKLRCSVLVELLAHNPLAARLGLKGESEWKLSLQLLSQLPRQCLLLADRLYGCGAFIIEALEAVRQKGGHILIRARESIKAIRLIRQLSDGSQVVEIEVKDPAQKKGTKTAQVRQIKAQVQRAGFRSVEIKLWTSLMDEVRYPASELVALYMRRWEHELYFRELKHMLGVSDLLRSQTVETAGQEVVAMIIATSLVAGERAQLKPGQSLEGRVSFIKTWQYLEPLWLTLQLCGDLLSEEQKNQIVERFYQFISGLTMQKKRARSCPRVLRQPQQPWPKKRDQPSHSGPIAIQVIA